MISILLVNLQDGRQESPEQSGEDVEVAGGNAERGRGVESAVSQLIREWAEKVLGVHFSSLMELAKFLVKNLVVDGRSEAAFALLPGNQKSARGNCLDPSGASNESKFFKHFVNFFISNMKGCS